MLTLILKMKFRQWRGYFVVFGAFLMHSTLASAFITGNMAPYIISYLRLRDPSINLAHIVWFTALQLGCIALLMVPGGFLAKRIGPKNVAIIGCLITSVATALTYFSVKFSFIWSIFTFAILNGVGVSLAYASVISCALMWFQGRRGIITGIVVSGFGLGSFVYNELQTLYLNPTNIIPDKQGYFNQSEILDKVPNLFLILGGCYLSTQVVAFILVKEVQVYDQIDSTLNVGFTPLEVLHTSEFYKLWISYFFYAISNVFTVALYKTFGQTFISDDQYLAFIGAIAFGINGAGRFLWGIIIEQTSYKTAMISQCVTGTILLFTMPITSYIGKLMYAIWICVLNFALGGAFVTIPACVAETFGMKYFGITIGMVFSSGVLAAPLIGTTTQMLIRTLGYFGVFYLLGGCVFICLLLTMTFHGRRPVMDKELSLTVSNG